MSESNEFRIEDTLKNLAWYSHNFLLPFIRIKENVNIIPAFIFVYFIMHDLRMNELSTFVSIVYIYIYFFFHLKYWILPKS